ncbi:MAG: DoxX family protein [Acidobacteriota bacterium]|nr:DoxX family protein [Acidobacteriota bacterium]
MSTQTVSLTTEDYFMESATTDISTPRIWTSRILSAVAVLFLLMDGGMKVFKPPFVVQATIQLGYPESTIVGIGVALLICTLLYVIPRTAIIGAIFLTGYLGGAVASNVRAGTSLFNIVFPLLFAVWIWAPLVLRNRRLESILLKGE